jgi:hypothetical protein
MSTRLIQSIMPALRILSPALGIVDDVRKLAGLKSDRAITIEEARQQVRDQGGANIFGRDAAALDASGDQWLQIAANSTKNAFKKFQEVIIESFSKGIDPVEIMDTKNARAALIELIASLAGLPENIDSTGDAIAEAGENIRQTPATRAITAVRQDSPDRFARIGGFIGSTASAISHQRETARAASSINRKMDKLNDAIISLTLNQGTPAVWT